MRSSQFEDADETSSAPILPHSSIQAEEMKKFVESQDIASRVHGLSLQAGVGHAEQQEEEEGKREDVDEEDEDEDDEDFYEDDLMWFDGHQGVSGNFTKTFKAEVAGNRPNTAASQHAAIVAKVKQQKGQKKEQTSTIDQATVIKKFQPASVRNAKVERKICTETMTEKRLQELEDSVQRGVFEGESKGERQGRTTDKADRATTDQVLDPRTRMVLYKLLNKETLHSIHGCISTGKEANVYYATTSPDFLHAHGVRDITSHDGREGELAIKVYKTSILVFKDRDKYVSGDYRFRNGYSKHNPRKMDASGRDPLPDSSPPPPPSPPHGVHRSCSLPPPRCGSDALAAGKNGKAARRLKDVQLSSDKMCKAYFDCVMYMRAMYQKCKLVHGDLSEYNMLYLQGTLYIIDVSQAVDLDHPNALEFLRRDAANVNDFFHKKGVNTMTVRQLFDFCVDESIGDKEEEAEKYLMELQSRVLHQTITAEDEVEAAVFQQAFIPQNLSQIEEKHFLREKKRLEEGDNHLYYGTVTGMTSSLALLEAQRGNFEEEEMEDELIDDDGNIEPIPDRPGERGREGEGGWRRGRERLREEGEGEGGESEKGEGGRGTQRASWGGRERRRGVARSAQGHSSGYYGTVGMMEDEFDDEEDRASSRNIFSHKNDKSFQSKKKDFDGLEEEEEEEAKEDQQDSKLSIKESTPSVKPSLPRFTVESHSDSEEGDEDGDEDEDEGEGEDEDEDEDEDEEGGDGSGRPKDPTLARMSTMSKAEWKKLVKAEKAEARKAKVPLKCCERI
eukprot:766749-Hanusia_phi.AAC.5